MVHHQAPDAMVLHAVVEIDGCLQCIKVSRTGAPWMGIAIGYHLASLLINEVRILGRHFLDSPCHLVSRHQFRLVSDGGVGDVIIIDVSYRLGIR